MNDVTDSVFRQIIARFGAPDVFFTEFVSVESLASPGKSAMDEKLQFTPEEEPLVVQVWGNDPDCFESQCRELSTKGYAGIDINMGCPVNKIISKGSCSALINDRALAKDIISASQSGISTSRNHLPLSVKTRIGFDHIDLNWIEFLLEQKLSALIIHCRTAVELSKVPNHFEVLPEIVEMRNQISPETKLIGNGDIKTRNQGEGLAQEFNLDGIMIGRGIFSDPFVFAKQSPWNKKTPEDKLRLYLDHIELFDKTWQGNKNPEILKKFAKVYITDFQGAFSIRESIMGLRSVDKISLYLQELLTTNFTQTNKVS